MNIIFEEKATQICISDGTFLYVLIYCVKIDINHSRCSSKVGKKYAELGGQKVSLGDGCNFEGTITHELLHALGKKTNRHRFCFMYFW